MKKVEFKYIPLESIKPYPKNAKKHPVKQVKGVSKSIKDFNFLQPIVIDKNNVIVAGHCRYEAAKTLNLSEVPIALADDLTEKQIKAYRLLDNKLSESEYDLDIFTEELIELEDYDFTEFGVDMPIVEVLNEGLCDEDEVPEIADEPITKLGDIWILGSHRLMCGDSTLIDDVEKLMNGHKPNLMVTDPPYGVKYEAGWRAKAKNVKSTDREDISSLQNDEISDWFDSYSLFQGNIAYVWHASAFTDVVMNALRRCNFDIKQQIIWNKNVHALSRSDYHWKHEPCWYAVRKNSDHSWNKSRTEMTVWDIPSIIFEKDKTSHPTQKPIEIYIRPIENHTKPNDYVYDPFGGSGSLIIACEKTGRKALSIEIDPKFCDVIIKRWQKFTGKQPVLESNGKPFDEVVND